MNYDVIIIGAGPGGIFSSYELIKLIPEVKAARLSDMLGGGVIVQRFGDLIRGRRFTQSRIDEAFINTSLKATIFNPYIHRAFEDS